MRREDFFEMRLPVPNQVDAVLEEQYGPRFLTTVPDVSRWPCACIIDYGARHLCLGLVVLGDFSVNLKFY